MEPESNRGRARMHAGVAAARSEGPRAIAGPRKEPYPERTRGVRRAAEEFWLSAKVAGGRSTPTTGCGRIAPSDAKSAKNRQGRRRCFPLLFLALLATLASWRATTVPTRQSAALAESRNFYQGDTETRRSKAENRWNSTSRDRDVAQAGRPRRGYGKSWRSPERHIAVPPDPPTTGVPSLRGSFQICHHGGFDTPVTDD